ncbi:MAG: hypothetical protein IKJ16_06240 [Agathobacter sp.]|nr:hypothetical protein [Agathobacter sp.]
MENYENNVTPEVEEVAVENPYGQDFENYQTQYVSKEDFLKNHETLKKNVKVIAIISYVLIGLNAVLIIQNPFIIIDIVILLVCTLGAHLKKNKVFAIALLVYGIFSVIIGLISAGTPTGWMWIVFGILYITQINKAEKEYASIYGV